MTEIRVLLDENDRAYVVYALKLLKERWPELARKNGLPPDDLPFAPLLEALSVSATTSLLVPSVDEPDKKPDDVIDARGVARMLNVSARTVARLTSGGELQSFTVGRSRRYRRETIEEYMNAS